MKRTKNETVARVWLLGLIVQIIIVGLAADCAPGGGGDGEPTATPTATATAPTTPGAETPVPEGPHVTIQQGDTTAVVLIEYATTPAARQQGLMFREEMDEDAGMLFIFPANTRGGFWMQNTYIPLDIAFIREDGTVLEIHQREPLDTTSRGPAESYRYVIEVNQGWFERHGLGVGAKVTLPPQDEWPLVD